MSFWGKVIQKLFPGFYKERKQLYKTVKKQSRELDAARKEIASLRNQLRQLERTSLEYMDPALYPHAVRQWYLRRTGNVLDLDNPRTFNEKIQWMKLYDSDPRKALLADKYRVREWVAEKIGEQYLTPLLGVYRYGSEIDFDALPNQFVLKVTHGSHMNAVVTDKTAEDLASLRKKADAWLHRSIAFEGFELHYNDIPRRIVIEELLQNADGDLPDFKLWCFNGKVRFIELIVNRKTTPQMAMLDPQWQLLPFTTGTYPKVEAVPEMPEQIPEMIRIAEILSEGFPHVRVDLYLLDSGEIRFGEMTFTTSAGACRWTPPEADFWVGEMLQLPDPES